jgi:hypothetical protein
MRPATFKKNLHPNPYKLPSESSSSDPVQDASSLASAVTSSDVAAEFSAAFVPAPDAIEAVAVVNCAIALTSAKASSFSAGEPYSIRI